VLCRIFIEQVVGYIISSVLNFLACCELPLQLSVVIYCSVMSLKSRLITVTIVYAIISYQSLYLKYISFWHVPCVLLSGDVDHKPYISSKADSKTHPLDQDDEYLSWLVMDCGTP